MKLIQILLIFYYMLPIGNTQEPKRTRKQKLKKKPQYIYIYIIHGKQEQQLISSTKGVITA